MVVSNFGAISRPARLAFVGGGLLFIGGLATTIAAWTGALDESIGVPSVEFAVGAPLSLALGFWVLIAAPKARSELLVTFGIVAGAVTGLQLLALVYSANGLNIGIMVPVLLAFVGAGLVGLAGLLLLGRDVAERTDGGSVVQPTIIKVVAVLGGLAMLVGPLLKWRVMYGLGGFPTYERGIGSELGWSPILGWLVVLAGLATLLVISFDRYLPLTTVTGLVGGLVTVTYFMDVRAFRGIPDAAQQPTIALIGTMGGAALAGIAGVAALIVLAIGRNARASATRSVA